MVTIGEKKLNFTASKSSIYTNLARHDAEQGLTYVVKEKKGTPSGATSQNPYSPKEDGKDKECKKSPFNAKYDHVLHMKKIKKTLDESVKKPQSTKEQTDQIRQMVLPTWHEKTHFKGAEAIIGRNFGAMKHTDEDFEEYLKVSNKSRLISQLKAYDKSILLSVNND